MRRILTAATLAAAVAFTAGCASEPPPVSEKVQKYYDENVATKPTSPTKQAAPVVAFIGDSYSAGAGGTPGLGWTSVLSQAKGWDEQNFGLGGTGYIATAGREGCGKDVCPNYSGVVDDVAKAKPSIVVVSGGRNDVFASASDIEVAATDLFAALHSRLPKAKIVVTSPIWDAAPVPEDLAKVIGAVKAAATATKTAYVDLGQPLTGHGAMLSEDKVHPNDLGYAEIAKVAAARIKG